MQGDKVNNTRLEKITLFSKGTEKKHEGTKKLQNQQEFGQKHNVRSKAY